MEKKVKDIKNADFVDDLKDETPVLIVHPSKVRETFGQKAADVLTSIAGSWVFIISLLIILVIWMILNAVAWMNHWDPYPFILLNLVLSCLAAIQAPIILMSQNRESQRDRLRSQYDYAVNRKAEKEIQEIRKQLNRIEKKIK
ncbi:MAG: DUF1003 domain-containing protein [Candidatus Pacearchaeota archaeon]|nr:DUF1003 domain-containing protein [Candidatus Pacearchaeota archaeon]